MSQRNVTAAARGPNRLAVALTISLTAHVALITLLGSRPQYPLAQAPGAIEVRIVPASAAAVARTDPAAEAIESVPVASSEASRAVIADDPGTGESSRLQASRINETRTTRPRQAIDAPAPMLEHSSIAVLPEPSQSGSTFYADSEVDVVPVALDPIVPRYPSDADAVAGGGKVTLRLLIDAAGAVEEVTVVESGLPETFVESARQALIRIRFKPAEKDGQAVRCQIPISVVYAGS